MRWALGADPLLPVGLVLATLLWGGDASNCPPGMSPAICNIVQTAAALSSDTVRRTEQQLYDDQSAVLSAEMDRAGLAETAIDDSIDAAQSKVVEMIQANVSAQMSKQRLLVEAEQNRSKRELDDIEANVTSSMTETRRLLKMEKERATRATAQRELLKAQVLSLRKSLHSNYCPPPTEQKWIPHLFVHNEAPNWVSETVGCPNLQDATSCLNDNAGYTSFREAWIRCGEIEGCGRIMNYTMDGKLYLRRRSDMAGMRLRNDSATVSALLPVALILEYECMPLCPVTCQRQCASANSTCDGICGHCAGGTWQDKGQRCLTPRRAGEMEPFLEASGACPDGYTDCRVCKSSGL
eukprot:TRINITY_DN103072_c0_g1_i1.p1 TRINITY_DN103072_c0_g1~~TRINITY_DN103072_c0_g1_i1.p1  ORF type:complete len:352 (+),score=77.59 TRINITY_DN103072_c0_g1_i1:127-1182(+)